MNNFEPIFKKNLASKSALLKISSVLLATNLKTGGFRSIFEGNGIEFSSVREYFPGDNVRAIDWNVTARMGRAFVKQYEEDQELNVFILLDGSASMHALGGEKFLTACWCAALLSSATHLRDGAVGAILFDGELRFCCPPISGFAQNALVLSKIDSFSNSVSRGTAIEGALNLCATLLNKRSLIFVISDFRVNADLWKNGVSFLAAKHDVVAIKIEEPFDFSLPHLGTLNFFDSETLISRVLPTSSSSFEKSWKKAAVERANFWRETCAKNGVSTIEINTKDDVCESLSRFFAKRRRR